MSLLLCLKIFFVRILDVSLGTFRTIITVKGKAFFASLIGFIEVLIWFIIVKEALNTSSNSFFVAFSYSMGFACGTYIGSIISRRLIHTNISIQIITNKADVLIGILKDNNYGISILDVYGKDFNLKKLLIIQTSDRNLNIIKKLTTDIDSKAFIYVNETKYVFNGYY